MAMVRSARDCQRSRVSAWGMGNKARETQGRLEGASCRTRVRAPWAGRMRKLRDGRGSWLNVRARVSQPGLESHSSPCH